MSAFTGIGNLIGVMIGGADFAIMEAMVGGVASTILVSSGIEVQIKDLKARDRFDPFTGVVVISYVLAFVFTFAAIKLAPNIAALLTTDKIKPDLAGLIVQYAGPPFAGGIGTLIPVWLSVRRKAT